MHDHSTKNLKWIVLDSTKYWLHLCDLDLKSLMTFSDLETYTLCQFQTQQINWMTNIKYLLFVFSMQDIW